MKLRIVGSIAASMQSHHTTSLALRLRISIFVWAYWRSACFAPEPVAVVLAEPSNFRRTGPLLSCLIAPRVKRSFLPQNPS
jgi:hypothetical protein